MDNENEITKPGSLPGPYHVPVLLTQTLDGLMIKDNGIYVDCTFGGGGHARAILNMLGANGKLFAFDQDGDAKSNLPDDNRVTFVPSNFRHLQRFLRLHKVAQVDGIMADLGVSSHQFDEPDRGFSTRFDAALDMRMDKRQTLTAYDVLKTYSEPQLHKLFEQYGEVTNSKTLAHTIASIRTSSSLKTVNNFKAALHSVVKGNPNKYFAQVFQALRIEVNDELGALRELLQQIPPLLKPGGRVAIITFHSLEDRLVKVFFRDGTFEEAAQHPFEQMETFNPLKVITRKPIIATEEEVANNKRSRSARLRIAEKVST